MDLAQLNSKKYDQNQYKLLFKNLELLDYTVSIYLQEIKSFWLLFKINPL